VSLPRARADVSFVRALRGEPGTFAAQDFAGHAVLAAGHPVAGTPWFTVASVERSVVEQQIRRLLLLITGISALGFVAAAALVLPWWRSVRARADALVQQAESRADELAARLGWVTRHASDVILLLDENGRILDVNDRAEQVYGYTRDELLTRDVFSLRPAGALAAMARPPLEAVSPGNSLVFETVQQRKDGTTFPAEVSSRQVSFGDRAYVQSILRDISERRRTEDRLRDSEAQYRLLFRSNPHPMWVYDLATLRFLAVNDAAIQHYGYSEAEFLGLTLADIRLPADLARLNTHVVTHADEVLQLSGIWQHRIKDGSLIDVEITSHSIDFDGHRARLVLANDVTSRVRAERQLRVSEERYRRLFENASDGIVVMTRDHRILAANPELQQMLGYSVDELLGLELPALLDPQEHVRLERSAAAVRRREFPGPSSWLHRRKDGSVFPGEVRIRALPDGELLATVRDLTEINAARRRIERQRDLYDLLSQCNQAIVKITDRPGLLQAVARLAVERGRFLFAWVGELNAQGDVVPVASHGDDHGYVASLRLKADAAAPEAASPASRALREGQTVISNDFLHDPATACFHAAARRSGFAASAAFPIFTGEGVAAALMLYATEPGYFDAEITTTLKEMSADVAHALDALRTQRELEDNRLLLQSVINAADALVFAFDLEGRAILMNEACGRAMGVPRNSMLGRRRDAVMPRELARAHEMNDRQVIESGEKLVVEECNVVAGVETVYLSVKYPLRDIDGRTYAVGGVATDITELRHMQRALAAVNQSLEEKVIARTREADEARARAEAADKAKTVFLSSMSHELRSPLHSIIGFTSVLLDGLAGDLAPAQQEHLRVVSEASHHLLAIINDLLDMSKIEAGAVSLELRPMPVGRLLDRLLQRFRLQAEQKGLELRLDGPGTEVWIDGDELRIEQIVSNLIANAIKYTPAGAVRIDWDCKNDELRIDVRDTGPGISAEDQARLFRRFSQLQPRHGGLVEGTGLGLAIAAGLAEAMGGNVVLRSEMGVGSVFSLRLPLGSKEKSK
jgi:PAS domain S-box-containing protein